MDDLTVLYYTSNRIAPKLRDEVVRHLHRAVGNSPIIVVSQFPIDIGASQHICVGDLGQNCWNVYYQLLIAAKHAETKYVAVAEDDCFYSYEHFHTTLPPDDAFLYDLNRWVMFTWIQPPVFGYRNTRLGTYQLLSNREFLIDALDERFRKFPTYESLGWKRRLFGEPGRNEDKLGLTVRPTETFWSSVPSLVFNHENSLCYLAQGKHKAFAPIQTDWLLGWGKAEEILATVRSVT
jgi:hypothetical protein